MEASTSPGEWASLIEGAVQNLVERRLLRLQRPTLPELSATKALIHKADLEAWAAGQRPLPHHLSTAAWRQQMPASVQICQQMQAAAIDPGGVLQELTLFSLNDYLGLACHPDVRAAAAMAACQFGMGPRSSAIVGGTTSMHRDLELALAQLKGTEDCLLFPTGYAANMAVVTALSSIGSSVAILSDELNHASIIDGARLAHRGSGTAGVSAASSSGRTSLHIYRHNDMQHLEQTLAALPSGTQALVVTDSLFSMDGDFADLQGIARLRAKYGFLLAVDEAHATLVCGDQGAGAAQALGVADQVDIHVGTLSKAVGALGGFVACSRGVKDVLMNKGRSYVYSTALPLPVVSAAQASLMVSAREAWRRTHVWNLVSHLGRSLGVPALSPVVPLVVGGEQAALDLAGSLLRHGMHVPAIRPPTVPQGTCRLRVSLSAAHSLADVDRLVEAVRASGAQLAVLPHLAEQQRQPHMQGVWPAALRFKPDASAWDKGPHPATRSRLRARM